MYTPNFICIIPFDLRGGFWKNSPDSKQANYDIDSFVGIKYKVEGNVFLEHMNLQLVSGRTPLWCTFCNHVTGFFFPQIFHYPFLVVWWLWWILVSFHAFVSLKLILHIISGNVMAFLITLNCVQDLVPNLLGFRNRFSHSVSLLNESLVNTAWGYENKNETRVNLD